MKKTLTSFILIILISCQNKQSFQGRDCIEIDMSIADTIEFDTLVKDISCLVIDLESDEPVKNVLCYKEYIYIHILSFGDCGIYIYTDTGQFLNKITTIGKGKVFFPSNIFIDTINEQLWILDDKTLKKYTLEGDFISTISLPFKYTAAVFTDTDKLLLYDGNSNRSLDHYFVLSSRKLDDIEKKFIPKSKRKNGYIPESMFTMDSHLNIIYTTLPANDTIYSFNPVAEELSPYYYLNFHGDFLSESRHPKDGFTDKEMHDILQENRYVHLLKSFYWVSDKLFFRQYGKNWDMCYIDTKNHTLKIFDSLFDGFIPQTAIPFLGSDESHLYCFIKAQDFMTHYKNKKSSYKSIPQTLSMLDEDTNSGILISIQIK